MAETARFAYLAACAQHNEPVIEPIAVALSCEPSDKLYITNVALSDRAATCLAHALKDAPGFGDVSLTDLRISPVAIRELCQTLFRRQTQTLDLRSNAIDNSGAAHLAEALVASAGLRSLDLQRNAIQCQGAIALAAALQLHSCGLLELSLRFNELGDAGAGALGKALGSNGVLRSLNLGGNLIGPEGVVQLVEGLRHNASLVCLNLRSNRAGDAGAVAVAQMLCDNGTLRELYLGCNGIEEAGALALAHSWRANTALEKVDVQGFPTIKFWPGKDKSNPIDFDGSRDLDGFVEFIKAKASTPFELPSESSTGGHDKSEL